MDNDDTSSPPSQDRAALSRHGMGADHAFDLWLQRSLHALYDRVTQEPIPAELLRLIEEDRARRKA